MICWPKVFRIHPKKIAGRQLASKLRGSMKIEALLTEAEISEEFAEAMEARDIPEKFFYWHPLCVRAWLAFSKDVAYESRLQSWNLLLDDVERISSHFDSIVAVISLGAGDGSQDVPLLKALKSVKLDV